MVINNEIFDSYRDEVKKIHSAIRLLVKHRYKIIDLENQLIHSGNVERPKERVKGYADYGVVPKHNRVYLNNNKNEQNVN
jgi:hypothetical protein